MRTYKVIGSMTLFQSNLPAFHFNVVGSKVTGDIFSHEEADVLVTEYVEPNDNTRLHARCLERYKLYAHFGNRICPKISCYKLCAKQV